MFKAQHTIITPVVGYNFKTALTVHNFHSQGSIPCRAAYCGVQANTYTTYPSHPTGYPFIHLWIKCVLLKDKSARHWRESNPQPLGNLKTMPYGPRRLRREPCMVLRLRWAHGLKPCLGWHKAVNMCFIYRNNSKRMDYTIQFFPFGRFCKFLRSTFPHLCLKKVS